MAKKSRKTDRAKRNKRNRTFSKIVSALIIIFAIGYFLYKNVPEFKDFADSKILKAKTAAQKFIGDIQAENPENSAQNDSNENFSDFSKASEFSSKSEEKNQNQNKNSEEIQKSDSNEKNGAAKTASGLVALEKNLEIPLCESLNHAKDHERRDFEYYSICYRESYEQAEWSAYCLTREHLEKNASRSDDFRPDPQISTGSAALADYKGSGYDRGHLSPAADFSFDKNAMSETFYMSNMSPQAGSFNRGIWKDLESSVRGWAKKFGRVYVVSGPVLENPASEYESIGENKVSIPQYYYKVLLAPLYENEDDAATPEDAKSVAALGFIFPNTKCSGSIFDYTATIDEIEKRTNLDFFSALEDIIEDKIESEVDTAKWK